MKSPFKKILLGAMLLASAATMKAEVSVDPVITETLAGVSADSIKVYIDELVSFHTRHNLSTQTDKNKGLGAAVKYLEARCQRYADAAAANRPKPTVEIVRYDTGGPETRLGRKVNLPNLMVTLPGTEGSKEIILLAHMDTRVNDNSDGETYAPGANDDGSGVCCLLEVVRLLSQVPLQQTVKCIFVSGEEHGLLGAGHMANVAKDKNWPVIAVLNNDMIGNAEASETGLMTTNMVRCFSDSPKGEDSDARQLARYIKEMAATYVPGHEVKLIYRNDRYRRGGDHTPFLKNGYPAIRMCEYYENYDRTHQVVREENGIKYGDVPAGVCVPYLIKNIKVNLSAVMNLAQAPSQPTGTSIANANALSNYTILDWDPVLKADGKADETVSYQVLYRETDQSTWQVYQNCPPATSNEKQQVKLPISKDNFFYAIRAIKEGHASLPAMCY